ncbi:MAG: DUF3368 domain-containing protein [Hormoscilla sp. GUM202]|nr:DUF3368 domain-containing protein [Hormoscilla sp. GM7CHS1pb]MBO1347235.1 DUF3368 domain-containing protein [Hormoscilla sp. GUM202]
MPNTVVVNTSPLLYLHQINQMELLRKLYGNIIVPPAVFQELKAGKIKGVDVPELNSIAWISMTAVADDTLVPAVIDLGRGEAEVIALGLEKPDSLLIFDDRLARRIADLYNLTYTGTLGVLVKAKQAGYIASVAVAISMLRTKGMWLTDKIIDDVLQLSGE